MKEPLDLRGFKFHNAPVRWELVPEMLPVTSLQLLLEKFYEEWQWHSKPLGWARDPENKDGTPVFPHMGAVVAPCRCNFYFVIEKSFNTLFGPHKLTLFYRSHYVPNEFAWVAIAQIEGLWHSDERLRKAFMECIEAKQLFQSEDTAGTIVYK